MVEEIENSLLGKKYNEKQIETNQNICSPTIDREVKRNIKERNSNQVSTGGSQLRKVTLENGLSGKDIYDIDVSDTEQD